jgi:hypothetical protein
MRFLLINFRSLMTSRDISAPTFRHARVRHIEEAGEEKVKAAVKETGEENCYEGC